MSLEIERKYLLKSSNILDLLKDDGVNFITKSITQFYTHVDKNYEIRYRKSGDTYEMSTKNGTGMVREEQEQSINEEIFKISKKDALGVTIKKRRYSFKLDNLSTSIDVYKSPFENLCILEIEFLDEKRASNYILPNIFQNEIEKEVTQNSEFKNKYLALFGNPLFKNTNLHEVFENIQKSPFEYDFLSHIPPALNSYGACRAIFWSLDKKIAFHKNRYLKNENNEDLHQIRVNIRKTRSLLQCMEGIFDNSIKQRFIADFKTIANASNSKRDMDVFSEYLEGLDEIEAEIILESLHQSEVNSHEVLNVLKGDFYSRVLQEWDVVLKDDDGFFKGNFSAYPFKKIGAIAIFKRLKKMKKKLSLLDEWVELERFHSIRIEFKKLRYLSEYFSTLFENTSLPQLLKTSKKMQNIFGLLQDRDAGFKMLKSIENEDRFASNVEFMYSSEVIQEILKDDIYSLKCRILYGKETLFKLLNRCMKDLKVYIGE